MYKLVRPFLFLLAPEIAHSLTLNLLKLLFNCKVIHYFLPKINENIPVQVYGLSFKNSVGIAAGLDKNGDYIDCLAALGVGFIEVGAVTPRPQRGNPKPRLFRLVPKQALINRMGFNNKGVDHLVKKLKQRKSACIVGVNIGKNQATPLSEASNDYISCFEKVYDCCDFVTINISSPNTKGLRELQNQQYLQDLLALMKNKRDELQQKHHKYLPLLVKISPDLSSNELAMMLETIQAVAIDGVIATNTSQHRQHLEALPVAQQAGGLSGSPITDLSGNITKNIHHLAPGLDMISVGGIDSMGEANQRFSHGAKLITDLYGFSLSRAKSHSTMFTCTASLTREVIMPNAREILKGLFIAFVLISIVLSYKVITLGWLIFPIGVVTIAGSFIIYCIYADLYGKEAARKLIVTSIICQISTIMIAHLLCRLPSVNSSYEHYAFVFHRALLPAIADAICLSIAYWITSYVMERTRTDNKYMFAIRSVIATLSGEVSYNFIWVFIAMMGNMGLQEKLIMSVSMIVVKLCLAITFSVPGVIILFFIKRQNRQSTIETLLPH